MEKKIFIHGFKDKERLSKVKSLAKDLGLDLYEIKEEDLKKTPGDLLGEDHSLTQAYKGGDVDTEFMLFSDFDRSILQKYILDLRQEGIKVDHKCVVTKYTMSWEIGYIIEHIMEEHEVMEEFKRLKDLVEEGRDKLSVNPDENLKNALDYALSLSELEDVSLKDVKDRYEKLKEAISN